MNDPTRSGTTRPDPTRHDPTWRPGNPLGQISFGLLFAEAFDEIAKILKNWRNGKRKMLQRQGKLSVDDAPKSRLGESGFQSSPSVHFCSSTRSWEVVQSREKEAKMIGRVDFKY